MIINTCCFLVNKAIQDMDLGIPMQEISVKFCFESSHVECVREIINDDDKIDKYRCLVSLISGDSYEIGMSYKELNEILMQIK